MTEICVVYSTYPHKGEALSAARILIEKRLVACANIYDGVTSVYRWEGAIQQEGEAVLIAKTSLEKCAAAMAELKAVHSYALPCITAWPVSEALPEFLRWVVEETSLTDS